MGESTKKYCEDCEKKTNTVEDHGAVICTECGLVLSEMLIDDTKDVLIFDDNEGQQRVEESNPLDQGLLTTFIAGGGGADAAKLRNAHRSASNCREGKIKSSYGGIANYASILNISDHVCQHAQLLYAQLYKSKGFSIRGKNQKAIMVGCLYHGTCQLDQPKSLEEFASATHIPKKDISQARKLIIYHVDKAANTLSSSDVNNNNSNSSNNSSSNNLVKAEVVRICTRLQMRYAERRCVEDIADRVHKCLDIRKAPNSQAAAIVWIFMTLNPPTHQRLKSLFLRTIAVSLNTLRQTYSLILPHLPKILPSDRFGEPSSWQNFLQRP